ncbi:hypothetical protein BCR42DRAFT_429446 [Absidia repens]|uniref:Uncharacterized protein n=1 Tax=Absidia repens TaxID=90262 RepID=A0A1X2HWX5_9FUNG|nr:hypothetical protein BCR42DRAFT_429446 [Absidia repens]
MKRDKCVGSTLNLLTNRSLFQRLGVNDVSTLTFDVVFTSAFPQDEKCIVVDPFYSQTSYVLTLVGCFAENKWVIPSRTIYCNAYDEINYEADDLEWYNNDGQDNKPIVTFDIY